LNLLIQNGFFIVEFFAIILLKFCLLLKRSLYFCCKFILQ